MWFNPLLIWGTQLPKKDGKTKNDQSNKQKNAFKSHLCLKIYFKFNRKLNNSRHNITAVGARSTILYLSLASVCVCNSVLNAKTSLSKNTINQSELIHDKMFKNADHN